MYKRAIPRVYEGLGDVVPLDLLPRVRRARTLDLLIGGMTEIDIDDWARFPDSNHRGYEKTDRVIERFWAVCGHGLRFTTGTSRVPVNVFKDLQGSDGPRGS